MILWTSLQSNFWLIGPKFKKKETTKNKCNFCMGDLGGYGIAELPPAGPLFARGPYRALGQKGNPWEIVRNSISTHVTHAEITHMY